MLIDVCEGGRGRGGWRKRGGRWVVWVLGRELQGC